MTVLRAIAVRVLLPFVFVAASLTSVAAQPSFPQLTGRVVDNANLLSNEQRINLTQKLEALEAGTTDQLVVVTLPSLQGYEIADYGYQLGRHWAIGQKDKNNGVLLIVAPDERKVRIEVGYGLEGTLTDALTRTIIETSILPHFRSGDMATGIVAGSDDIIKVLTGNRKEIAERLQPADQQDIDALLAFFWIFAILIFVIMISRSSGSRLGTGYRRGAPWIVVPGSGSGGGWSGGGYSGGGGGFSGGGGSFGGGGSSGSW